MRKNIFTTLIFLLSLFATLGYKKRPSESVGDKPPRIIIITLDGLRWQELFTGAEKKLVTSEAYHGGEALAKVYWRDSPQERREILLPFIWGRVSKMGVIHGNRLAGSYVNVSNQMWFSYPGYNEILTGKADDARISSNDKNYNPNKTFLERLNEQPEYKGQVAAFCSWEVFPYIINDRRSGIPVNAGFDTAKGDGLSDVETFLNENVNTFPNLFQHTRLDAVTGGYAMEYLKRRHPKALYIAFGETDDFAHQGHYNLYLDSARNTDRFLENLWNYTQSDPFYKDNTTFIVTTDHGRGIDNKWPNHAREIEGADQTWLIMYGKGVKPEGEVLKKEQIYATQVAKEVERLTNL